MFFKKVENLEKYENSNDWGKAINLLYNNWEEDKDNPDKLLRLATECWYVLTEWEFLTINKVELNKEFVKQKLIKTYSDVNLKFSNNDKVLVMFGYMISLFPFYFYDSNDVTEETFLKYENIGKEMLKKAFEINSTDYINKLLYLGSSNQISKDLNTTKKDFKQVVDSYFSQNTEIERYFTEVLTKEQ